VTILLRARWPAPPARRLVSCAVLFVALTPGARPGQSRDVPGPQWKRVESKAAKFRFSIPPAWQTKSGVKKDRPYVEAVSPDTAMYVFAYSFQDADMSNDDVLDQALDELGVDLDDDPEEEDINGLDALVGEATDTVNGREVGLFLMVASSGDTRYVAYVLTDAARFDANASVMNRILDSFAPLTR
jgi:hypothetical protein